MYIGGTTFRIETDHQALSWLKMLQNPAGRLARWPLFLKRFDYTIVCRKGSTNFVADALSRAPLSDDQVPLVAAVGVARKHRTTDGER